MNTMTTSNKADREVLKKKYGKEMVFVVKKEYLPEMPEGFVDNILITERTLDMMDKYGEFVPRWQAEYNPEYKQIIPHIVIKNVTGNKVFATRRLEGSGEARLHNLISLGTGGHINPEDNASHIEVIIENASERELNEELYIDPDWKGISQGFLNDNLNSVSSDHLGVVIELIPKNDLVCVKEIDKHRGTFYSMKELSTMYNDMESWSRILYDLWIREGSIF